MTPTLSILICSLGKRSVMLQRLLESLRPQINPLDVELIVDVDDGEMSIGAKRNSLLLRSTGRYVCFIDDDDKVADDYVREVLSAIDSGQPDCVGFKLDVFENGRHKGLAIHSLRYEKYGQRLRRFGPFEYERTPNHLNPVRRELALQVMFPELNFREDTDYAERLRPLLETEVFIDKVLYQYLYVTKK